MATLGDDGGYESFYDRATNGGLACDIASWRVGSWLFSSTTNHRLYMIPASCDHQTTSLMSLAALLQLMVARDLVRHHHTRRLSFGCHLALRVVSYPAAVANANGTTLAPQGSSSRAAGSFFVVQSLNVGATEY